MNERRAVLLGGGHSHALALLAFARRPLPARIVLVSDSEYAPYSGMLPGVLAGQFTREESLIHLPQLCARVGAKWRHSAATAICGKTREISLADGATESFDVLSANVGGAPVPPFAGGIAVKPAAAFTDFALSISADSPMAIVGAGAGGTEIALALRRRFPDAKIALSGALLPFANDSVRRRIREVLSGARYFLDRIAGGGICKWRIDFVGRAADCGECVNFCDSGCRTEMVAKWRFAFGRKWFYSRQFFFAK